MNGTAGAAGDQGCAGGGLHSVQSYRNAVDGIGAAAFGNREGPLASGAHHQIAFAGHRFAVEVGVGDGFGDYTSVVGSISETYSFQHYLTAYLVGAIDLS